jgi:hypothetical protein
MSTLETQVLNRCCAILRGGAEAAKYSEFYRDREYENRNNYSGRFNPNLTNKSSSGSISRGNINISSVSSGSSGSSMGRTGPNLSGYSIY